MFGDDVGNTSEFFFGVEHTSGVAWRREHDEFCARSNGGLKLFGSYFEVVFQFCFNEHTFAFGEADEFFVANPEWGGNDDFVAGVDEALHYLIEALFGSGADDNLFGFEFQIVVAASGDHHRTSAAGLSRNAFLHLRQFDINQPGVGRYGRGHIGVDPVASGQSDAFCA